MIEIWPEPLDVRSPRPDGHNPLKPASAEYVWIVWVFAVSALLSATTYSIPSAGSMREKA